MVGIRGVVRVRPNLGAEAGETPIVVAHAAEKMIDVNQRKFGPFYAVLDPTATQEHAFVASGLVEYLDAAMQGYSATVLAYGQTGSGKTHSLMGNCDGLVPRAVDSLFKKTTPRKHWRIRASFCEIGNAPGAVNERITDLLAPGENLHLRYGDNGPFVADLTAIQLDTLDDAMEVLREGSCNRRVGAHALNLDSSRSHSLFTLFVEHRASGRIGKLTFVDLAGSERLKLTKAEGLVRKETQAINKSLFTLGQVIMALAENKFVPFRNSKLTELLRDSLGGNSLCLMVTCLAPISEEESRNSLLYASRAMKIENHPIVTIEPQRELELLREENRMYREMYGPLGDATSSPAPERQSVAPSPVPDVLAAFATPPRRGSKPHIHSQEIPVAESPVVESPIETLERQVDTVDVSERTDIPAHATLNLTAPISPPSMTTSPVYAQCLASPRAIVAESQPSRIPSTSSLRPPSKVKSKTRPASSDAVSEKRESAPTPAVSSTAPAAPAAAAPSNSKGGKSQGGTRAVAAPEPVQPKAPAKPVGCGGSYAAMALAAKKRAESKSAKKGRRASKPEVDAKEPEPAQDESSQASAPAPLRENPASSRDYDENELTLPPIASAPVSTGSSPCSARTQSRKLHVNAGNCEDALSERSGRSGRPARSVSGLAPLETPEHVVLPAISDKQEWAQWQFRWKNGNDHEHCDDPCHDIRPSSTTSASESKCSTCGEPVSASATPMSTSLSQSMASAPFQDAVSAQSSLRPSRSSTPGNGGTPHSTTSIASRDLEVADLSKKLKSMMQATNALRTVL